MSQHAALCDGESGGERVRGQIYRKFKSPINPEALQGPWPAACRTVESSLIWPRRCCVRAELCCQQILGLWRRIHN